MGNRAASWPVIGVTGGIGSGKSLVASMFGDLGCEVIDADKIGHMLLRRPEIIAALAERFGPGATDDHGQVDRPRLAELAFADAGSLAGLNEIMHLPLRAELVRRIEAFRTHGSASAAAVIDAALLFETDWHTLCDATVFVDATDAVRCRRAAEGKG